MTLVRTPEQVAICDAARYESQSLMTDAGAGTGKSSTAEMAVSEMPPVKGLAIAFNKKIAEEQKKRLAKFGWESRTLNGIGHSAWGKAIGKNLTLDDRKLGKLINEISKDWNVRIGQDDWIGIRQLVSAAMQRGLVPSDYPHQSLLIDTLPTWQETAADEWITFQNNECWDLARAVLIAHIKQAFQGVISYDDQIYMSAMFNGVFWRHQTVLIDESQDLSPLNHIQLARVAADRIFAIGDPRQAIYAFRGADSASMAKILNLRKSWTRLPLNTTFRCPKAIVARQQKHYPGYRAADSNIDGEILDWTGREWTWDMVEGALANIELAGRTPTIAIICRNNAPLVKMAFRLIRRNKGVFMLGRDIGKGLVALCKKLAPDDAQGITETVTRIRDWSANQIAIALANDDEAKADKIRDQSESLLAVVDAAEPRCAGELRSRLVELFSKDSGRITLSSGHRAKGLEYQFILHIEPDLLPSRFAKKRAAQGDERALEQEYNLNYVIETRAQHTLAMANIEDLK